MTLDEGLQHIYSLVNKDQSGNTYNLSRYNNDLLVANIEYLSYCYGLLNGYQPGMPAPPIGFEITQRITDFMSHLIINMGGEGPSDPGPLTVTNGIAIIPDNYAHVDYINYAYVDKSCGGSLSYPLVDILTGAQWSNRINSSILNEQVEKYPYCNFQNGYLQIRPKTIQRLNFVYLRKPTRPYYDYYIDATDAVKFLPAGAVYNLQPGETGSNGQTNVQVQSQTVELEWPEDAHPDIFNIILGYVSDNLRSGELKQSAELRKANGI